MKNFFKALGDSAAQLAKTAAINAIKNPKTTAAGVAAIGAGVTALSNDPKSVETITGGIVGMLTGLGLVLADDPSKDGK